MNRREWADVSSVPSALRVTDLGEDTPALDATTGKPLGLQVHVLAVGQCDVAATDAPGTLAICQDQPSKLRAVNASLGFSFQAPRPIKMG